MSPTMSLRSKGKIQPKKSNHSTRQTRIRYDEVEIDSGGEMALYSSTRNEHFTSNIALWTNYWSYLGFCRRVRKMCECFRSEQKKIFLVGKEKQHGLAKTPYHSIRSVTLPRIRFFIP